jgi:hypothetical protein
MRREVDAKPFMRITALMGQGLTDPVEGLATDFERTRVVFCREAASGSFEMRVSKEVLPSRGTSASHSAVCT